tara:strand:- start:46 stop:1065 length:1020 start_codon:yes stop_codon:yes gene_type:complete
MATFEAQVEGLTSLSIDGSSAPTQTELTQFLTDGAKEIINSLPMSLLPLCTAQATFTSMAPGSEAETLNTGKILNVFRNDGDIDQPCRQISAEDKGRVSDESDMSYAKITDPVYYIENNKINALPSGGSCKYSEVQYPAVAYGESAISVFPDEAEYLVALYASIKSLQNAMSAKASDTAVSTALTAMTNAVEAAEAIIDTMDDSSSSVFGDSDTFTAASSQLTRVKAAIDNAEDVINTNQPSATTDAYGAQANEDIELVTSALNIAQTELSRAQMHLSEWVAIGDMRIKQINASLSEAQGYGSEIQARLSVLTMEYNWMEKQQVKLESDYEKGLQRLRG